MPYLRKTSIELMIALTKEMPLKNQMLRVEIPFENE
jgi:hypothetical protein